MFNRRKAPMHRSLFAVLLTLGLTFALAGPAQAATTFLVNETGDQGDGALGDGECDRDTGTGGNQCTLRAAAEEIANQAGFGPFTVNVDAAVQGNTISSATAVSFTKAVTIEGCFGVANPSQPCVGLTSTAENGLIFTGTGTVRGLAIKGPGSQEGIFFSTASNNSTVENTWVGIGLDGSAGAFTNGILVRGDNTTIGGTTAAQRNVISNNTIGIRIEGDNTSVKGNYLGTNSSGTSANQGGNAVAGNATNIAVTRAAGADPAPTGTVIGGTLSDAAAGTAACDGACNLISRATSIGIDLDGPGAFTAGATTISGNYVGLDVGGTTGYGNGATAVSIPTGTDDVVVGGPSTLDRNVIAGPGTFGVIHSGTGDVTVRNNFLGLNAAGTADLPFTNDAVVIAGDAAHPGSLRDNRIAHADATGTAVELNGTAAQVQGNIIGIGTGGENLTLGSAIRVTGNDAVIGGTGAGDANIIGNSTLVAAIRVDGGDGNTIIGNKIGVDANGTARPNHSGICIRFNNSHADNNVVGGDTAAEENTISNSTNDAILISTSGGSGNRVFGNNGSSNGGLFVDIGAGDQTGDGAGNPANHNGGAAIPALATATTLSASGTGAGAGATVRVFTTTSAAGSPPSALGGLAGKAVADGAGNWTVTYSAPLPNDTKVAVNQTTGNSSSELGNAMVSSDATPPDTTIDGGPSGLIANNSPSYTFSSNEGGTFECKVDSGPFSACTSGFSTGALADGEHTFQVRARDVVANVDPTPASRTFTVDTAAPDTAVDSGPSGLTNDSTPTFGLSSTDAGAGIECRIDGGAYAACGASFTPAALADGQHTLEARSTDAAGNADQTPASRTFTVDTAAPNATIGSGPSGPTKDSTPSFAVQAENGATFECRIDGGTFAACPAAFTAPELADGAHTFEARAKDAVGNTDATPASRSFVVDTKGPKVGISPGTAKVSKKGKFKIRLSCPKSELGATCTGSARLLKNAGAKAKSFSIARGESKTLTLKLSAAALDKLSDEGKLRVKVRVDAKDPLGNGATSTRRLRLLAAAR